MEFPYGEWVIFFLVLVTWAEKRNSRRFFLTMLVAWLIGKYLELIFPFTMPWHWHFARLSVLLVFWGWAWQRAERKVLPLLLTSFVLSLETLFLVNEPGVIPYESWLFTVVLIVIAWQSGKSYWGTAAAFAGSLLLNQVLVRLTYEGLVKYADFPDTFIWNFGVGVFAAWAGLRLRYLCFKESKQNTEISEPLLPANGVKTYESIEEQELL